MAALEVELENSDGFTLRPVKWSEIDALFSNVLCHEAWAVKSNPKTTKGKGKGKARAKAPTPPPRKPVTMPDMFVDLGIDANCILKDLGDFKAMIEERKVASKNTPRPLRSDEYLPARLAAVTSCHWPSGTSNYERDLAFFYKVGLLELYMLEEVKYRQPLMATALGEVRNALQTILNPCVEAHTIGIAGAPLRITTWLFLDRLEAPPDAKASTVDHKEYLAEFQRAKAARDHTAWLEQLRQRVDNYPPAWAPAEDDNEAPADRALDQDVSFHLDGLLHALWANARRIAMRERDGSNAVYNRGEDPIPQDLLSLRDSVRDNRTIYMVSFCYRSLTSCALTSLIL